MPGQTPEDRINELEHELGKQKLLANQLSATLANLMNAFTEIDGSLNSFSSIEKLCCELQTRLTPGLVHCQAHWANYKAIYQVGVRVRLERVPDSFSQDVSTTVDIRVYQSPLLMYSAYTETLITDRHTSRLCTTL